MTDKLNVSLESHLRDSLAVLVPVLPGDISRQLLPLLTNASVIPVIPYDLILKISKWCQTTDGKAALKTCSPPLDPLSYTMVSLLAGTRTSPEKHFPPHVAKDPEEERRLQTRDRKAITTLVNAVLSIVGTGVATWWASEHTRMQLEWRALLAVAAALVVAFAEIVLYIIWDSRQALRSHRPTRKYGLAHKNTAESKGEHIILVPQASSTAIADRNLHHRTTALLSEPAL